MKRHNKLINILPDNFSAGIITSPENLLYFLGIDTHGAGTLVVLPEKMYFVIDFRYIEICKKNIKSATVILQQNSYEQISDILSQNGITSVFLEQNLTLAQYHTFKKNLACDFLTNAIFSDAINTIRQIKESTELEYICKAQEICDTAYRYILTQIAVGKTEKELQLQLDYFMLQNGADALAFDTIFVSGKNSSLPHGVPTSKKLENGDFVTMDFGAKVCGYCTDMTRTIAVGYASEQMQKVYSTVLEAQLAAISQIKDGVDCAMVDKTARDIIKKAGYGDCFGHSTGHGVGLLIHEEPRFSEKSTQIARTGMVITVEPGIYIENGFGVRIEDTVTVTEKGCYIYGKTDKTLTIIK